jgi:putative oxidoreductase
MSQDLGKLLLRLTVAGLLLLHGLHKLRHGISGINQDMVTHGLPSVLAWLVYLGEVVAPIFVLIGIATRPAAVVIFINMAVAIWLAHAGQLFTLGKSGGWAVELDALYGFGALAIALLGTGRYAAFGGVGRFS